MLTPNGKAYDNRDEYSLKLDENATEKDHFTPPTFGSLPRNFFRAPGRVNLDFSLEKRTHLSERVEMIFRAEFFNILNHTEWQSPVVSAPLNTSTPQVGQILSTFDPRIGQVALRFTF